MFFQVLFYGVTSFCLSCFFYALLTLVIILMMFFSYYLESLDTSCIIENHIRNVQESYGNYEIFQGSLRISSLEVNTEKKLKTIYLFIYLFFDCYLVAPCPTLGHYLDSSHTHLMLITAFSHIWLECHKKPRSEVGSVSLAELLMGFEPGTFRFW